MKILISFLGAWQHEDMRRVFRRRSNLRNNVRGSADHHQMQSELRPSSHIIKIPKPSGEKKEAIDEKYGNSSPRTLESLTHRIRHRFFDSWESTHARLLFVFPPGAHIAFVPSSFHSLESTHDFPSSAFLIPDRAHMPSTHRHPFLPRRAHLSRWFRL